MAFSCIPCALPLATCVCRAGAWSPCAHLGTAMGTHQLWVGAGGAQRGAQHGPAITASHQAPGLRYHIAP